MDWRPLHNACWAGDTAEAARLLEAGADPNRAAPTVWRQRPLHRTLEFRITHPRHEGHVEVVRLLVAAGADASARATPLDMTPWELACLAGVEAVERELRAWHRRATPHPTGMSALWLAASSRWPERDAIRRVRQRLAAGDEVTTAWRQATPLMMAAAHAGHFRVADALLGAGATAGSGIDLMNACCTWHFEHLPEAIDYLVGHGCRLNDADANGQTALHKAAFLGAVSVIRRLLAHGADPARRDTLGMTPLAVARTRRRAGVVKLLE